MSSTNIDVTALELYVVVNNKGQFFRAKGYGGGGQNWVDDIRKAKIYGKLGPARSTVTYFSQDPKYPVPIIAKLKVDGYEVLDEKERVKKVLDKKKKEKEEREVRQAQSNLKSAEAALKRAQDELDRQRSLQK